MDRPSASAYRHELLLSSSCSVLLADRLGNDGNLATHTLVVDALEQVSKSCFQNTIKQFTIAIVWNSKVSKAEKVIKK